MTAVRNNIMKIGFDASGIFGHGGIDRYARELMRHVVTLDTRNSYVALTRTRCEEQTRDVVENRKNVEIRTGLPHDLMLGPHLTSITRMMQTRVWRKTMSDVDLVHFTSQWRWLPPVKRFIVTVHDLFPLTMPNLVSEQQRDEFTRYLDQLVKRAALILTPSHFVERTIAKRYPEYATRIRTTPLAAGAEFVQTRISHELLTRIGLGKDDVFLLFIGRVDERKNIERMIRAFLEIPSAQRVGIHFLLGISGMREDIDEFKETNAGLLQNDAIRAVYGLSTDDIIMLLSQARALAFASLAEGFGLPVLEAMRCGCPVLTSNVTSLPEVAGDAALLVDPYNVVAIRDAMLRLIADDDLVADLRVRGLQRAQHFSWENTARLTLKAYNEVLSPYSEVLS